MIEEIDNPTPTSIEKSDGFAAKKHLNNAKNGGNFRKLIAEIIVEIVVKRQRNGRNRIHQDK